MDMSLDTTLKIGLDTYRLLPGEHCDECAFYAQEVRLCPATQNRERLCETHIIRYNKTACALQGTQAE